ncbi:hypothetical protein ACF5F1_003386 [Salmonella enterica]
MYDRGTYAGTSPIPSAVDAGTTEKRGCWCGPDIPQWISNRLAEKEHPAQAYRLCLGQLSLTRAYPAERVNSSCRLANSERLPRLKQIKSLLETNRDFVPWDSDQHPLLEFPQEHENIRGPRHCH